MSELGQNSPFQTWFDRDSSTPFFGMLATFAAFESDVRRERQAEGIAKAKADGVYQGRQPTIELDQVLALKTSGLGPTAIAATLGISRQSVYRLLRHPTASTP